MTKEIYFAAGCFWGAEHYFKQIVGVAATEVGFANGDTPHPTYKEVYTDATGYAETVHIEYNPQQVGLLYLLEMYFKSIDPTSLNKQGEDCGTRYRTGIYYTDPADLPFIQYCMARQSERYAEPLQVEVRPLKNFYRAEEYHQDYLANNPDGYCHLPAALFEYARNSRDAATAEKDGRYGLLCKQVRSLVEGEADAVAVMANVSALIQETFHFWWTGFYRVSGEELLLGPFQGPVACMHIAYGKGVCGAAWQQCKTIMVPDVERFPGHIACSADSRSEIVVPVVRKGKVVAVLDIDSQHCATFDECDRYWLEQIATLIAAGSH